MLRSVLLPLLTILEVFTYALFSSIYNLTALHMMQPKIIIYGEFLQIHVFGVNLSWLLLIWIIDMPGPLVNVQ